MHTSSNIRSQSPYPLFTHTHTQVPQYQVTESSGDAVRHNSPPLFVPDSRTPLVASVQPPQLTYGETPFTSPGNQAAASALVSHQLSFPSSSAVTSYTVHPPATRTGGHHMMPAQYTGQVNAVPLSAYNPTYLVTQSNQLLDQHKQHLFKPDRHYGNHQPQPQQYQNQQQLSLRHPGSDLIETEFLPSFQLPSGDYVSLQTVVHHQPSINTPQSPEIVSPHQQGTAALSIQEVSNLLNFGSMQQPVADVNNSPKNGFIASRYYHTDGSSSVVQQSPNSYDETIYQHQQQNEERINAANRQALLSAQQAIDTAPFATSQPDPVGDSTIFVTRSPEQRASEAEADAAHQRHQQRLAEHAASDMRIYVPDEDYSAEQVCNNIMACGHRNIMSKYNALTQSMSTISQSDTFHKRSDDFAAIDNAKAVDDSESSPTTAHNATDVTETYDESETVVIVTDGTMMATKRTPQRTEAVNLDASTSTEMSELTVTNPALESSNNIAIIVQENETSSEVAEADK